MSGKKVPNTSFSFGRFKKPAPNACVSDTAFAFGAKRPNQPPNVESKSSVQRQSLETASAAAQDPSAPAVGEWPESAGR